GEERYISHVHFLSGDEGGEGKRGTFVRIRQRSSWTWMDSSISISSRLSMLILDTKRASWCVTVCE
ncbi:hypothetical protein D0Y65_006241, partial [Glycine soja]